jgi:hypothetical protein
MKKVTIKVAAVLGLLVCGVTASYFATGPHTLRSVSFLPENPKTTAEYTLVQTMTKSDEASSFGTRTTAVSATMGRSITASIRGDQISTRHIITAADDSFVDPASKSVFRGIPTQPPNPIDVCRRTKCEVQKETILGFRVVKGSYTTDVGHGQTLWMAPALNYAILRQVATRDGKTNTTEPVSIKLGPPDPALFDVPADYRTMANRKEFEKVMFAARRAPAHMAVSGVRKK